MECGSPANKIKIARDQRRYDGQEMRCGTGVISKAQGPAHKSRIAGSVESDFLLKGIRLTLLLSVMDRWIAVGISEFICRW